MKPAIPALLATLSLAVTASAQVAVLPTQSQEAVDEITLRDGSILRGHVAAIRAGVSTTITLLTGEERVVPAADIAATRGPTYSAANTAVDTRPAAAAAAPPTRPTDPDDYTVAQPGRVPLVVTSTGAPLRVGVLLETVAMLTVYGAAYAQAPRYFCETPCTLYVRPGAFSLFTGGPGLREALTELEVPAAGLRVRMRASSASAFGTGYALTALGTIGFAAGAVMLTFAPGGGSNSDGLYVGGSLLVAAGLAALIPGIVLFTNNQTGVASSGPANQAVNATAVRLGFAPALNHGGAMLSSTLTF